MYVTGQNKDHESLQWWEVKTTVILKKDPEDPYIFSFSYSGENHTLSTHYQSYYIYGFKHQSQFRRV